MRKFFIPAILTFAVGVGGYLGFRANNSQSNQLSDVMLANVEALADIESIGGNDYIVDNIPCTSAYNGRYDVAYTVCSTCLIERGFYYDGLGATCTSVRPLK